LAIFSENKKILFALFCTCLAWALHEVGTLQYTRFLSEQLIKHVNEMPSCAKTFKSVGCSSLSRNKTQNY